MAEYIDRGDLVLWLNKKSCEYSMNDIAPIGWTLRGLVNELATFPSADVVERKAGRWIPMEVSSGRDSWKCSVCGRRARGKLENLPYCHCGAKMEGDPFDDNPPMEYFESGGK